MIRATRLSGENYNTTLSSDSIETGTGSSNPFRCPSCFAFFGESFEIHTRARDKISRRRFVPLSALHLLVASVASLFVSITSFFFAHHGSSQPIEFIAPSTANPTASRHRRAEAAKRPVIAGIQGSSSLFDALDYLYNVEINVLFPPNLKARLLEISDRIAIEIGAHAP
jgi:hypothetical protein